MADLMFSVRILDEAKKLKAQVQFAKDDEAIWKSLQNSPGLIVIDLNYAAVDPLSVIRRIKADPVSRNIPLVGFVSHVQTELRQAAAEAGCDKVYARSAFAQNLGSILALRRPTAETPAPPE